MAAKTRITDGSAVAGAVGWLGLVAAGPLGPIREIIALAMLVLVPLGLRLADAPHRDGRRTRWYRAAVVGQPLTGALGVASLVLPPGAAATVLAVPWAASGAAFSPSVTT